MFSGRVRFPKSVPCFTLGARGAPCQQMLAITC
ncbi:hypothetical protein FHX63_000876 [Cupriavidus plantarum]|uniref:Uncharacterized protein n=1 Tax=Cupriavidus plantarum TaxID=942865 RepID=A0A316FKV4_9BURK|nr:hypothetical protein [Cupriavidus plantarum]PWK38270.1 hypothetical protein C7419_1012164 [Cupriavidus plantarum]CAG2127536.1 hypothetical protein LMG26296_00575 [Cupriavidus plantarum]